MIQFMWKKWKTYSFQYNFDKEKQIGKFRISKFNIYCNSIVFSVKLSRSLTLQCNVKSRNRPRHVFSVDNMASMPGKLKGETRVL